MNKLTCLLSASLLVIAPAVFAEEDATTNTETTTATETTTTTEKDVKEVKQVLSDSAITAKVKEKFIAEKLFGDKKINAMTIHVKTKKGIVYLTGKADNQDRINTAVDLAKKVDGVKDVIQKVKVEAGKTN